MLIVRPHSRLLFETQLLLLLFVMELLLALKFSGRPQETAAAPSFLGPKSRLTGRMGAGLLAVDVAVGIVIEVAILSTEDDDDAVAGVADEETGLLLSQSMSVVDANPLLLSSCR